MRLDYNEKRGGREVERKPVPKNRPRKEPVGMFALLSVLALVLSFGAGVATGWFFFKGKGVPPAAVVAAQPVQRVEPAPPPQPGQPVQPAPDAPLTFYKTLPAGGKGVMGSGMNLKLPPAAPNVPRSAPAAPAPAQPQPQGAKQESQEKPDKPEKQEKAEKQDSADRQEKQEKQDQAASTRYLVQIASYRDKKEADEAQARLSGKGLAVYVVESRFPDKSVWYRLRVGRHLSKSEAEQLALKAGKGAAVVAE